MPLSAQDFDRACHPVAPGLTLQGLLPRAASAVIVASGGRDLFAGFRAAPEASDGRPDPLDRFTRAQVVAAVDLVMGPAAAGGDPDRRILFPFVGSLPALPFQRLGRAAGLGGPGPMGIQIHPEFGPWWAYRALIALTTAVRTTAPPGDGCAGCDAPCVGACPGGAVRISGFSVADCHAHRLVAPPCQLSCAARIRCVRGTAQRYDDQQLSFHMAGSMPVRRP